MPVARSVYYRWLTTEPARQARLAAEDALAEQITVVHAASGGSYGSPRVAVELRERGLLVNRKRVERLMRERGIVGAHQRRRRRTTIADPAAAVAAPDLLERDFTATAPDQRWCGDITYLRVGDSWMYLATVINIASRRLIGWSINTHMRTSLVIDALAAAVAARGGQADSVILHGDRGSQYTSGHSATAYTGLGIRRSMGRVGSYDNALAESFFATLKRELDVDRRQWSTTAETRHDIFRWIAFYNHRRRHSALDHTNPTAYELQLRSATVQPTAA